MEFKKIEGWPYAITECGRVKRLEQEYTNAIGKYVCLPERELKVYKNAPANAHKVTLSLHGTAKAYTIVRLLRMVYGSSAAYKYMNNEAASRLRDEL